MSFTDTSTVSQADGEVQIKPSASFIIGEYYDSDSDAEVEKISTGTQTECLQDGDQARTSTTKTVSTKPRLLDECVALR